MFTELAISIHERGNPKILTDRILEKVTSTMTNDHEDVRGRSVNVLGTRLGSIPVITEGRLTHHPHVTRYVYFFETPDTENPMQMKGIAIDGRDVTEYEYRQGQPDSRVLRPASLAKAWELFTQVDRKVPVQFPKV